MKVQNKSKYAFQHTVLDRKKHVSLLVIAPGEIKDVPEDVAEVWLKTGVIVEYIAPAEAKAKEEELLKKIEQLEKENAALKGDNNNTCPLDIEALRKDADELGVKYNKNISAEKLLEKINEYKAANQPEDLKKE